NPARPATGSCWTRISDPVENPLVREIAVAGRRLAEPHQRPSRSVARLTAERPDLFLKYRCKRQCPRWAVAVKSTENGERLSNMSHKTERSGNEPRKDEDTMEESHDVIGNYLAACGTVRAAFHDMSREFLMARPVPGKWSAMEV